MITIGPFAQRPKQPVLITLTLVIFFSFKILLKFSKILGDFEEVQPVP